MKQAASLEDTERSSRGQRQNSVEHSELLDTPEWAPTAPSPPKAGGDKKEYSLRSRINRCEFLLRGGAIRRVSALS